MCCREVLEGGATGVRSRARRAELGIDPCEVVLSARRQISNPRTQEKELPVDVGGRGGAGGGSARHENLIT